MNLCALLNLVLAPKSRLLLSLAFAELVFLMLANYGLELRALAAWDAGVLCFLVLVWGMMIGSDADRTRDRAQRREVDHPAVFLLVVFAAFTSLFVISTVLAKHKDTLTLEVGLSIAAILCSWVLMHTMFTLHYAVFYYRPLPNGESEYWGGLEFSNEAAPCYLDFVYFTFTLGMTSQTSDTTIATPIMRRLALGHTLVSFFFYSVILALTVSVISGLI